MTESDDRPAAERAMKAMLEMTKIDIAKLEEAYKGEPALAR
jgi:predicted 3-demethylubiquinone-9 3-methyltransferase (glyoxalase superfamily)